jgi:opacity protein-like surface antigen
MKKTIIAVLAASVLATGAAQAAGFNGAYVGFDGGYSTLKTKGLTPELEGSNVNFGVQLGYGATISGNFYLGGEVGLRNSVGDFGDKTVTGVIQNIPYSDKTSIKTTTTKMFSILPGFVVSPNALIYGRLGKGNADSETTETLNAPSINYSETRKSTSNGDFTIYGIGVDYLMTSNLSVKAEANKLSADDADGTSFNVGVNYRF